MYTTLLRSILGTRGFNEGKQVFSFLVVYKLTCPSCNASYVGQTVRHVQQRVREHLGSKGIMKSHFDVCGVDPLLIQDFDFVSVLDKAYKVSKLLTLEALYISKIKPVLNTKDEFKSRTLTLKLY